MTSWYQTPAAYRQALEGRLQSDAEATSRDLNWLRRRHVFVRMLHRLVAGRPDLWVLKGGLAVELRRPGMARTTKDIDLALRIEAADADEISALLRGCLNADVDGDLFVFTIEPPTRMAEDAYGRPAWRFRVTAMLAGRRFADTRIDVISRPEELVGLTTLDIAPGTAAPLGAQSRQVTSTDLRQQFAEKLHALTRTYSTGESSRVKDLLDLVLLVQDGVGLDSDLVRAAKTVFAVRGTHRLPRELGEPPTAWRMPYQLLADDLGIAPNELTEAGRLIADAWNTAQQKEH